MKKGLIIAMAASLLTMTACTQVIELTEEQEDQVAAYAAGELLYQYKVSKGIIKLEPITRENKNNTITEKPTQAVIEVPTQTSAVSETDAASESQAAEDDNLIPQIDLSGDTSNDNSNASANAGNAVAAQQLAEKLEITGVELSVLGYSVEDRYPTEAYALSVESESGKKLLVVEYDVWNSNDAESVMSVKGANATVQAIVNGNITERRYATLLKNDIMNMDGTTFAAGEAKIGVLIFEIKESDAENITSVTVSTK